MRAIAEGPRPFQLRAAFRSGSVPGEQLCCRSEIRQGGNIKNHVACIAVLNRPSVENRSNREAVRVGNFIGSHETRSERTEGIKRFAATPLAATFLFLPISRADIVGAVLKDKTQGLSPGYVCRFLDHDGEFAFVVDLAAGR